MKAAVVMTVAALQAGAAGAQQVFCLDRQSGRIDPAATQAFAEMQARRDPRITQALAGSWWSETQSPATGQISRLAVTYGADGALAYQNQVCDASGACGMYQGAGAWAAIDLGNGAFSGIQMISDQGRNQECTGFSGRFLDTDMIQSGAGGISRRMR